MKQKSTRFQNLRIAIVLSALAMLTLAGAATAGQGIFDVKDACTGASCRSLMLNGIYDVSEDGHADCFQAQLWTAGNECVRLFVNRQSIDLEMVFTCPDGSVWRDDDSGGRQRPLIKADTLTAGWCTVQVCHWVGAGQEADFTLKYGRYPSGNRNCSNPTPPLGDFSVNGVEKEVGEQR